MDARKFLFAVVLLSCGFVAGIVLLGRMGAIDDVGAQTPVPPTVAAPTPAPATALIAAAPSSFPDFSVIAERTVPAVVNVSSVQYVQRRYSPFANDPFFLFDPFGDRQRGGRRPVENSLGSGVMVSSDGYILTNNHVVTGDRGGMPRGDIEITIALADNREMPARIIGTDPGTDLALLKVDGTSFHVMPWGDSQKLKVAEWVLAIGNPYQLSESVSLGIVSAVNRTNVGINTYENFIQTDAAINPGNSGGALVNARGELVGINTAIFSQSGGYQGIGFAVASHLARKVLSDLQEHGHVRRGTIRGVGINQLTTRLAQQLGAPNTQGVVVVEVDPRFNRTFRPRDIIVAFNGTAVNDPLQLVRLVGEAPIGSEAAIAVLREGRRENLSVLIEQQR